MKVPVRITAALGLMALAVVSLTSTSEAQHNPGDPGGKQSTPIILDTLNNGFRLTSLAAGTRFDLNVDGVRESCSWTQPFSDDAFLALDRNNNGMIDNGTELFGLATPDRIDIDPTGIQALAQYDLPVNGGNNDGVIDYHDAIYSHLILWYDLNHNGITDPTPVAMTPAQAANAGFPGVSSMRETMSLGTKIRDINLGVIPPSYYDAYGNWFRYTVRGHTMTQGDVPSCDVYLLTGS